MTHEELEDRVRRHELDIADLRKQNEQLTASSRASCSRSLVPSVRKKGASFWSELVSHFDDLRTRLVLTDKPMANEGSPISDDQSPR
jgi:phage shock protein A